MEAEYSLTLEDFQAFFRYQQRHGQRLDAQTRVKRQIILLVACFVLIGLFLISPLFLKLDPNDLQPFWYGIFFGWFLYFLYQFILGRVNSRFLAKRYYDNDYSRWLYSPRRMSITPEGLFMTDEHEKLTLSWAVVWSIDATSQHVFFYTTRWGASIVPRRAFRDKQHFQAFVDLACHYQQNWKPRIESPGAILDVLPAQPTGITRQPPT